jgi:alpha-amylase
MAARVRLILTLHNHQPIGNFDGVFEAAYADSYAPFLETLSEFPELPVVLHISGSLLEWLTEHRPDYINRVRELVQRGQIELLGGPFYESILACIPRRDRLGQMRLYKQHLEDLFDTKVRGMWVPERVWEQTFAGDIAEAGIEYTLLDDTHFRNAGLQDHELHGYRLTEEDGRLLKVFAGGERLRYLIPYRDPHEVIHYCREIAEQHPNPVLIFGDDGEKFGVWPGSKELVFRDGWLRRFFTALRDNRDWLQVTTMAETIDNVSPAGRVYLPDASYREMTEWSLPSEKQWHFRHLIQEQEQRHDWYRVKQFMRAGFWRNFLVKYPEANEMYSRMQQVSRRVEEAAAASPTGTASSLIEEARRELYRAQCNCPYWHGAFGGLYLPHLRNAVYSHLIAADTLLEKSAGRKGPWIDIQAEDFNLDARKELRLAGDKLVAYIAPGRGGHLYELDVRPLKLNLLATLNRRPEPYHDKIRQHAGKASSVSGGGVDPNGGVCFKQPDLDQKLQYDAWPRKSLVDHFFQPGLQFDAFTNGQGELGDFVEGVYQSKLRRSAERVEACLWREGKLGPFQVKLTKTIALNLGDGGTLDIQYALENLPPNLPVHFGVEFNFAAMPAGAADRYFYGEDGHSLGMLQTRIDSPAASRFGLVDEWLGVDVAIDSSVPANFWAFPIQTVSQSESGFELVHQSCSVVPHWQFQTPADGRWSVRLCLSLDTTASQARALAELRSERFECLPTGR